MKKAFLLAATITLLSFSHLATAQEKETAQKPSDETQFNQVITLKYADHSRVRMLLARLGFDEEAKVMDEKGGVIIIRGSMSHVQAVADIIKQLDVPSPPAKDVELTAYFLAATPQPTQATDLPPELNEVATQLKKVFNLRGFRLLNSTVLRIRDGEGGHTQGAAGQPPSGAEFFLQITGMDIGAGEKEPIIHLHRLNFSISATPTPAEGKLSTGKTSSAQIATDIDVPVGQKVVVGKTSFETSDNAMVLVLTARVVD